MHGLHVSGCMKNFKRIFRSQMIQKSKNLSTSVMRHETFLKEAGDILS